MAVPLITPDVRQQAFDIRETTSQAERRVQNEELLSRVGETIGGLAPVLSGAVAGAFANSPALGLATAFVADKVKQLGKDKAEKRRQRRLENRQRNEAAKILLAQGKVASKSEALAMVDEGILKKAQKAEQQRQENLLANFDLSAEEKDTEQQREENVQTERDNLETRVENAQIERENLEGRDQGLALESTVASIDNNVSAIGDLILDRFADQERNEDEQKILQRQQLLEQKEMRLEAERTEERDDGEPEKEKEEKGSSGLMRILPAFIAGLSGLIGLIGGVTTTILGKAAVLGAGALTAAAVGAKNLLKGKPATDVEVDKTKDTEVDKKKTGNLSKSKETMGDKATKQSPKKGGIGDVIKKFKRVAKKVGFKRLALLIGKRVGTTVAAGLFTGPFAIIVGLVGLGLAVYEIMGILDDIEKEFDEGKSVDAEPKEPQVKQDETQSEFVERRSQELLDSGEVAPVTDSNASQERARQKARQQAFREYREFQSLPEESIESIDPDLPEGAEFIGFAKDGVSAHELMRKTQQDDVKKGISSGYHIMQQEGGTYVVSRVPVRGDKKIETAMDTGTPISADELAKMSPEEAKAAGHIDFADQDDMNDRVEELRMKEQVQGEPEPVETESEFVKRRTQEMIDSGEVTPRTDSARSQTAAFRKARLMAQAEYVQRQPKTGDALASTSRQQQTAQVGRTNVVDARTNQNSVSTVNNNNTTIKGAPLNTKNQDVSNRYSSRYN